MNCEGMEAGWYADAASSFEDRGSLAPDEFAAAEQQGPPPALSGSLADADVIRHAIQLEREQAKSSLPKQVWEMLGRCRIPGRLRESWKLLASPQCWLPTRMYLRSLNPFRRCDMLSGNC